MDLINQHIKVPISGSYDVVVVGGGTSGVIAALASANNGAKTLLIERQGHLGGNASQLLEHFSGFYDNEGNRIVGGISYQVIKRLIELGASPGKILDITGYSKYRIPVRNTEYISIITNELNKKGVSLLLNSPVVDVYKTGKRIKGVIVENKMGRIGFLAKKIVDASGDADIVNFADGELFIDKAVQPVSLIFKLGNVDFIKLIKFIEDNPSDYRISQPYEILYKMKYNNFWGFEKLLDQAYRDGVVSILRKELHMAGWIDYGEAVVNVTRYKANGVNPWELSGAEVNLRKQVLEFVIFFKKYVPGCGKSFLAGCSSSIGVRATRRIKGKYKLTENDILSGNKFADSVALGGFPMDIHDPNGGSLAYAKKVPKAYGIPYRCMIPLDLENLIIAGRCISADIKPLASLRMVGTCMALGEAAGTSAAICAEKNISFSMLDIQDLRQRLLKQSV